MDFQCDENIDFNKLIATIQAKKEVEKKLMEGLEDYYKEIIIIPAPIETQYDNNQPVYPYQHTINIKTSKVD